MLNPYFLKQMVSLMHAPFHILSADKEVIRKFGAQDIETGIFMKNVQLLDLAFLHRYREAPGIFSVGNLIFCVFAGDAEAGSVLIAGPVTIAPLREAALTQLYEQFNIPKKEGYVPSVCALEKFVSGVLLLHWHLTGKELMSASLWDENKHSYTAISNIERQLSKDIFTWQENVGIHNPYEQELRELESIERGDVEALAKSISETYKGKIGILAKDPLRSHKNIAVGNITLASRAAIRGGMTVEKSFSLADSLIQQVEEIDNIPEVEIFKRKAQKIYTKLVNGEGSRAEEKQDTRLNPLVDQVKDYIFSHLHDTIQVADIAQYMQVNADYLSHLFSRQEKMTITTYIRREKIRRGKNLLKYSEYRIQEIAFYLGFCSQSHFSRVFQQIVGMSPNEYRRQLGNRNRKNQ